MLDRASWKVPPPHASGHVLNRNEAPLHHSTHPRNRLSCGDGPLMSSLSAIRLVTTASAALTPTGYNTSRSTFTGLSTVMWFQIMNCYVTLYCLYIAIKRALSYADFDL